MACFQAFFEPCESGLRVVSPIVIAQIVMGYHDNCHEGNFSRSGTSCPQIPRVVLPWPQTLRQLVTCVLRHQESFRQLRDAAQLLGLKLPSVAR